jgi:hypothetical protein
MVELQFLTLLSLPLFVALAQQPSANQQVVRGTGDSSLWHGKHGEDDIWLRFYSNGTVIGAITSASGTLANIERWFNAPYENSGRYSVSSTSIRFSLTRPLSKVGRLRMPGGTVDYDGVIQDSSLQLYFFSHINNKRGVDHYELVFEPKVRCAELFRQTSGKKVSDLTVNGRSKPAKP